jgi:hypothetical protein
MMCVARHDAGAIGSRLSGARAFIIVAAFWSAPLEVTQVSALLHAAASESVPVAAQARQHRPNSDHKIRQISYLLKFHGCLASQIYLPKYQF